jgi:hypothetical protein
VSLCVFRAPLQGKVQTRSFFRIKSIPRTGLRNPAASRQKHCDIFCSLLINLVRSQSCPRRRNDILNSSLIKLNHIHTLRLKTIIKFGDRLFGLKYPIYFTLMVNLTLVSLDIWLLSLVNILPKPVSFGHTLSET